MDVKKTNKRIQLRPAETGDAEYLLRWRNRPDIVAAGLSHSRVSRKEHIEWFDGCLRNQEVRIWIILLDSLPIGQIRLVPYKKKEKIISVFILPKYSGHGYGVAAIKAACKQAFHIWPDIKNVRAVILKDNDRSKRAFIKAGFQKSLKTQSEDEKAGPLLLLFSKPEPVPHNRLTFDHSEIDGVRSVLLSGRCSGGSKVLEFEKRLQNWASVKNAVCVGSGLGALRLSLAALGVNRGHHVIIPAYSCVALPNAVLANQAIPLLADIRKDTCNISPAEVSATIHSEKVKCIIAVNTFGYPADVDELLQFDIQIIEDWAHGFQLSSDGISPTKLNGDVAIQSFYATKLMGVGEGGVILTNSEDIAEFARSWRDYGDQPPNGTRLNDKMTDISAAIGISQLQKLPSLIRRRRELAAIYTEAFSAIGWLGEFIRLPANADDRVWYRYPLMLTRWNAAKIIGLMKDYGINAEEPVYNWHPSGISGKSNADQAFSRLISLPLFPALSQEEQRRVIDTVIDVCQQQIKYE